MAHFPDSVMRNAARWGSTFAAEWRAETPLRIHSGQIAPDGSPQWHPDFVRWMSLPDNERCRVRVPGQRYRTTEVMRRLRRTAPREYDVAYRVLYLGESLEDTTQWLNERAKRNAIPYPAHRPEGPHYLEKDTLAILLAAIGFVEQHW